MHADDDLDDAQHQRAKLTSELQRRSYDFLISADTPADMARLLVIRPWLYGNYANNQDRVALLQQHGVYEALLNQDATRPVSA